MKGRLAIEGGEPVRQALLPYGRQSIDDEDISAVIDVLHSDWLTTGPTIGQFEEAFAQQTGAAEAVAVSNGTAALHAAMYAAGVGPDDEVIVTPMTFAASANAAVYLGAKPIFADVEPETLLLDPNTIEEKITTRTRAIVAVDYAGQPCDYDAINAIAQKHNLVVIDDACHAVGGNYNGRSVGTLAGLNTFSLHPVKHLTTGEGGVITTDDSKLAGKMRVFRNHGITSDHRQRAEQGGFFYEMVDLGYNYRLTDFQAALGISQLKKLAGWVEKRQAIAHMYDAALAQVDAVAPLSVRSGVSHAYHLYMVQLDLASLTVDRAAIFQALRAEGIGVNVHYIPVHLHPYYQQTFGTGPGNCPAAEAAYERLLTLPIFPQMTNSDVEDVVTAVQKGGGGLSKVNIVAIMQARMGSTRLPGKVLLDIAGDTMLARAVKRLQRANKLSKIVIATTTETVDDQLAAYCAQMRWACVRGSETDVLDRYYKAATQYQADVVVRITSDCPLIEPEIVDKVITHFLAADPAYDYTANFLPARTFPRGLDTEVFTMEALKRAWQEDQNANTREHVTPYLYQQTKLFSVGGFTNPFDYSHHRWTVDTPEDLELIRRIYHHFGHDKFNWHDVLALLKDNPDWLLINQHIEQKKVDA